MTATPTPVLGLSGVHLFPNPAVGGEALSKGVTINHLPIGATIDIYDLALEKVRSFTAVDTSSGTVKWDCRNTAGENAASGVYFVVVYDGNGNRKILKAALVR